MRHIIIRLTIILTIFTALSTITAAMVPPRYDYSIERVASNSTILSQPSIMTFVITTNSTQNLILSEEIPLTWIITDWQIKNYNYTNIIYEKEPPVYYNYSGTLHIKKLPVYKWTFTKPFSGQVNLTYTFIPASEGKNQLTAYWQINGEEKGKNVFIIDVKNITGPAYCGNLICEKGEDWINCRKDCMLVCDTPCQITIVLGIIALVALGIGLRKIKIRRRI